MTTRLIFAVISTLLEEVALVIIVRLGLPKIGINIPLPGLIALMVAWLAYTVVTYRMGSRALRRKPLDGLLNMVGGKGEVVGPLVPEGVVRIKGELWMAKSAGGEINLGEKVIVVGQERLQLIVRKLSSADLEESE